MKNIFAANVHLDAVNVLRVEKLIVNIVSFKIIHSYF